MAVDSAVVRDFTDGTREYDTGPKSYALPGVGVVSTWGARDGNMIAQHLRKLDPIGRAMSIGDVAASVQEYLEREFQPHDRGADPVGYHVAGFRGQDDPIVYQVHWNPLVQETRATNGYGMEEHSPGRDGLFMLYNGRDDLVNDVLRAIERERQKEREMPLRLDTAAGLVALSHLALRFAREISFEVSPPFYAHVVTPENHIHSAQLPEWIPVNNPNTIAINRFLTGISHLRYVHHLV